MFHFKDVNIITFDAHSAALVADVGASLERSDKALVLNGVQVAANHNALFRVRVQLALNEADANDAQWIANDATVASWADMRAAWSNKANT